MVTIPFASPFVYAKKGENIDWSLLFEERCEGNERLSKSGNQRLIEALKSVESGKYKSSEDVDAFISELFA